MNTTYCLGDFARRIRHKPIEQWGAELQRLPEVCPHGCAVHCRAVCTQYARDQRELSKAAKRVAA